MREKESAWSREDHENDADPLMDALSECVCVRQPKCPTERENRKRRAKKPRPSGNFDFDADFPGVRAMPYARTKPG
jgi:hypothetical protein